VARYQAPFTAFEHEPESAPRIRQAAQSPPENYMSQAPTRSLA